MAPGTPADRFPSDIPFRNHSLMFLFLCSIYHIKTQGNRFATFRYIWSTVDTIIECIINLLFARCITKQIEQKKTRGQFNSVETDRKTKRKYLLE